MAEQKRIKKQAPAKQEEVVEEVEVADDKEELKDEMDAILDEIDSVLETNAEEFVRSYVQKGGQ